MYGSLPPGVTVPVNIVVSINKKLEDTRQILKTVVNLHRHNQEETAYQFNLNSTGDLVPGSVNTLRKPLITGRR